MKIQIQLDSQCEEPEILIRTAAVTAEIRELVEKLSEKRSDSVVGYDADSAVLLEKSQGNTAQSKNSENTAQKRLLHPTVQKAFPCIVLLREPSVLVLDLAPHIPQHPAVEVGDLHGRACHHQRIFSAGETAGREAIGFAFAAVEVCHAEAVTDLMFQHVNACAVQHVEVRCIRKPLSPVTAAAAEDRKSVV